MPRIALLLHEALTRLPGAVAFLSLSSRAELLQSTTPPRSDLPVETYQGPAGFAARAATAPLALGMLSRKIEGLAPDIAICVHPGPLDLLMVRALRRVRVPFVALVHDADLHPGDGLPFQAWLQRMVYRRAVALGAFTGHVARRIEAQGLAGENGRPLLRLCLPPIPFSMPADDSHRGQAQAFHLLMFGRLLEYKGLDLLAEALASLGPRADLAVRVVGTGPDSRALRALAALPGVTVENRWVPEDEIGALLGWSDGVVLPYREASQSGVAAAAQAAGRFVLSTRVGGLPEQLASYARGLLCEPSVPGVVDGLQRLLARRNDAREPGEASAGDAWRAMAISLVRQIEARDLGRPP